MAIPTGLSAQLMTAEETVYGTPVTPDRGFEFTTESLKMEIERLESTGLRSNARVQRSDRWRPGKKTVGGDVEMELANKSFGRWLKHIFGGVVSSQPDVGGSPTVWDHTFTPGDLPVGQTIQVGRTSLDGVVNPFTYHGCKIAGWSLGAAVGEIAKLKATITAEDEETATGLVSATYPTGLTLLTFVEGSLTVAAVAQEIRSVELTGDNRVKTDRHRMGSQLIKEPIENAMGEYMVNLDAFFDDLVAYNRFVNGTEAALVLLFRGALISGTYNFDLQVTANVRFDGETPNVDGADEIEQPLKAKCVDTGSGPGTAITVLYRTTDTTP